MGTEWTNSASYSRDQPTRATRERRLKEIAAGQLQLVSGAQLVAIGFGESTVRGRVKAERLHPTRFPRVFSLSPASLSRLQTVKAALLSCGHHSIASHWAAVEVLGLAESPPLLPVHVTRPSGNGRGRSGIVVHRSHVAPRDTAGRDGVLCTSAARTIVDLAAVAEPAELERILIAADSLRILNHRRLEELVDARAGRRGVRVLRSLLAADPIIVRSDAETEMLFVSRFAGLPEPIVNGIVEGYEVDFHWPELRLVVEVDGWRFHGGRERMNADRERDQRLTLAGWLVRALHPRPDRGRSGRVRPPPGAYL